MQQKNKKPIKAFKISLTVFFPDAMGDTIASLGERFADMQARKEAEMTPGERHVNNKREFLIRVFYLAGLPDARAAGFTIETGNAAVKIVVEEAIAIDKAAGVESTWLNKTNPSDWESCST
jgi:hypothetical protein